MGVVEPEVRELTLLRENADPLVVCGEAFEYSRPFQSIRSRYKARCRKYQPHDGEKHVTWIEGVGWYQWE